MRAALIGGLSAFGAGVWTVGVATARAHPPGPPVVDGVADAGRDAVHFDLVLARGGGQEVR